MQKLLEVPLTRGQMISLVSAFRNIAATMSKSQHAHHVIIHCIQRFPDDIKLVINHVFCLILCILVYF